ncbi:CxC ATPase DNA modification system associated small protein [Mucilaginibacter sp.]
MLKSEITSSFQKAVEAEGQPPELATKLIKWMESVVDNSEDINNKDAYKRRCDVCFDATITPKEDAHGN